MKKNSYWVRSRAPRYSITFAVPLLLCYEALAFLLSGDAIAGVRNGADVLLKSAFTALGGRHGLTIFGIVLLGAGAGLILRDRQRNGAIEPRIFLGMTAESVLYALALGGVAGTLTSLLLGHVPLAAGGLTQFDLPTRLMISLGAGLYEELVFRVLLVSGLAFLGTKVLGWSAGASGVMATILGALIFSGFHYIGPFGDPFRLESFVFRAVAGVLFSALYLLRGFGIAAWSHALYDIFLSLLR
ncbi:MAG: CPBP family intramembrane glutamic endopeptidase [Gemmatimonadales bacterium]